MNEYKYVWDEWKGMVVLFVVVAILIGLTIAFARPIKRVKSEEEIAKEKKERVESEREYGLQYCRDAIMYLSGAGEESDSFHRYELLDEASSRLMDARMSFSYVNDYYHTRIMCVSILDDLVYHLIEEGNMYSNMYVESRNGEYDTKKVGRRSYAVEISRIREVMKAYKK